MEPSTTDEPAKSHGNHTNKHHNLQSQIHDHHHGIGTLSSTSILIIIVSSISVVVVLTIFLIIAMLRRFKYSKDGGNCRDFSSCNTSKFIAHTTIRFTPSPGNCPMSKFLRSLFISQSKKNCVWNVNFQHLIFKTSVFRSNHLKF